MSDSGHDPDPAATIAGGRSPRSRAVLLSLVGIALLLIGIAAGLLIAAGLDDDPDAAAPAASPAAVGFAQDMIRHHEQGVEMAAIELENGTDPQVRSMAFDILTAQSNEIGQMQSWLTRWGQPLINPSEPMAWMGHDHAGDHHMSNMPSTPSMSPSMPSMSMPSMSMPSSSADTETPPMPGMATSAEMNRLRALHGPDADVYFLQLMLRHHEGGLHMMEYAADPANVSEDYVRSLATAMKQTQDKEIAIIEQMLAERNSAPLPMN
ncbi:DUF305 domain-containing protein [Gordonia sp. CPCC 206044]|uniref:DUF305 domain-containing protein n=1 Tax=Gordonia sp. CPCC 206044 TaxID=3140793 RepID=UPI003AF3A4CD